ncbi:SMODS domain-containing nucleotidyltransferase, partial [Pseudomonas syringae]|uniref:SMODS domain-containing nucleotidyltransferase n=1 Tax=Pseudomonas syringae TaxID=317 RepID=UPI001F1E98AD
VYIDPVEGWDAKSYINTLYDEFNASAIYSGKLRRSSHCITIEYAGEQKIDIAPCLIERQSSGAYEVCNRTSNMFEASRHGDYTKWLVEKNTESTGNNLRKVTRLLKYLRDIKTTFTCPSFLLTTLVGERVSYGDGNAPEFADVPSALKEIVGRLDDWLQQNYYLPEIRNPVLWEEIQSGSWDQTKYS